MKRIKLSLYMYMRYEKDQVVPVHVYACVISSANMHVHVWGSGQKYACLCHYVRQPHTGIDVVRAQQRGGMTNTRGRVDRGWEKRTDAHARAGQNESAKESDKRRNR